MHVHSVLSHLTLLALAAFLVMPARSHADSVRGFAGAVYTMDNASTGNSIVSFHRRADGSLSVDDTCPTGGLGTGSGLGNQNGLVLSRGGHWLFACNAGSDEISVFLVTPRGLRLTDKVSSEGRRPVSLALHRNLLYVLNAGGAVGDEDSISGFVFFLGRLWALPGSSRSLSAANTAPAQIGFTSGGEALVVTEKATGLLSTFTLDDDGLPDQQRTFVSPTPTPFGFASGRHSRIVVSEADGGNPDASTVSSYEVGDDGVLTLISASVPTTETAACWVVLTQDGKFAYASNTGSGSITGFRVRADGSLHRLDEDGVTAMTGAGSSPIDLALSHDGRYLYSLNAGNGTLSGFRVRSNGSLIPIPGASGIPSGANGLAAR